jgi:hypothetical protein
MNKREIWHGKKHLWHLSWGKARRLERIFDTIERNREAFIGLGVDTVTHDDTFNETEIKEGTLK